MGFPEAYTDCKGGQVSDQRHDQQRENADAWLKKELEQARQRIRELEAKLAGIDNEIPPHSSSVQGKAKRFSDEVLDNLPGLVCTIDMGNQLVRWNKEMETVTGYSAEELDGMNVIEFFLDETDQKRIQEKIKETYEKGYSNVEAHLTTKTGEEIPYVFNGNLKELNGVSYIVAHGVNVSRLTKILDDLKRSEQNYRNFITHASEGIYRVDITEPIPIDLPDEKIVALIDERSVVGDVNAALAKMYGLTPLDMIGKPTIKFAPGYGKRALLAVRAEHFLVNGQETVDIDKDGNPLYLSESYSAAVENGYLTRIWGAQRDITATKKADQKLKESEEHYRMLFETAQDAIMVADPHTGMILDCNSKAEELTGWSKAELLTMHQSQIHPPQTKEVNQEGFQKAVHTPGAIYTEIEIQCRDGSIIPVEISSGGTTRIGEQEYHIGTFRDLSYRKRADEALKESEEKYRTYVENAPEGIFIVDSDGHYIDVNTKACEMTGYSRKELLNMSVSNLAPPDAPPEATRSFSELKSNGQVQAEIILCKKDGTRFPASLKAVEISPNRYMGFCGDISAKKKAEAELHLQSLLLDQIQDMITGTDLNGIITYVNKAECLAFDNTPEEIIGKTIHSFGEDEIRGASQQEILESTRKNGSWSGEVVNFTKDGKEIILLARTQMVYDDHQVPIGMVGISTDITKRKRTEEALRLSEERFRLLLKNSSDIVAVIDENANELFVSDSVERVTGYTVEQYLGTNGFDHVHPEDRASMAESMEAVLSTPGAQATNVYRHQTKNGEWRYLEAIGSNYLDDPRIGGIILNIRDITDRKKAEEAIRHSEKIFRKVFDILPVGLWLADQDGTLKKGNIAGVKIWGGSPLVPQENYGVFKARKLPSGEEIAPEDWALAHTVNEGVTILNELLEIDAFDGVKRTILNSTAPVLDDNGEVMAAIVVNNDITQQKATEQKLAEALEKTQKLAEETHVFFSAAKSVLEDKTFEETARKLFDACRQLTGAVSGYVALTTKGGKEYEILFIEDGGLSCTVNPDLPMPVRGLRKEAYDTRKTVWDNNFSNSEWIKYLPEGHVALKNVMFVPLNVQGKAIGLIGLANKPTDFDEHDAQLAQTLGDLASIALESSRTRETLEISEAKARSYIENAPYGVLIVNQEGQCIEANKAASTMSGYSNDELLERSIQDIMAPESIEAGKKQFMGVLEKGHSRGEVAFLTKNGEKRYWSIDAVKISDTRFLGFASDVTQRMEIENALRESEETFRALAENSIDTIMRFDPQLRHLYVNPIVKTLTGIDHWDFIGKTHEELGFPSEMCEFWAEAIQYVFDTGKVNRVEFSLPHGYWLDWLLMPELDSMGNVKAVITSSRDITERVESEKRLKLVTEATADLIYEWDIETGSLTWFGDIDKQLGYKTGTIKPTIEAWVELIHEKDRAQLEDAIELHKRSTEPIHYEYRIRRENGTWRYWSDFGQPILGDDGKPIKWIGACTDITEKKHIEAQLRQSQKMESIGRLAGGVAHDFNNLLTGIQGNVSLGMLDISPDHPLYDTLEEISSAAKRATKLTKQLLAFSRKQIIEPKIVNVNEMIESLRKLLERLIGEDISIVWKLAENLGHIRADSGQIEQVVVNMVVNARDAMSDGGKLTIETDNVRLDESYVEQHIQVATGDYVMIAVSDNGIGMDADTISKIFEPFFTTKDKDQGTGLGLATAFGIIKQHGGNIEVYSEIDKGSTFKVFLPMVKEKVKAKRKRKIHKNLPRGSETILVVEDEPMVRNVATRLLTRQGYKVFDANTGPEAIELVEKENLHLDLLMTDIVMPKMNGRELSEILTARQSNLKTLFTSGYTEEVIAHHGILDSGLQFIGKPYVPETLAIKVRKVLDGEDE